MSDNWKKWQCEVCGWVYDEELGWPEEGIAPSTRWVDIPADWSCPECLAAKADFVMVDITERPVSEADKRYRHADEDPRFVNRPIVIIGTGLAGYDLVKELRQRDDSCEVVMITADDGSYYPKPVVSNGISKNKSAEDIVNASATEMQARYAVQIRSQTRVQAIDTDAHELQLDNGQVQGYRKLVLATGSRCVVPPLSGDGMDKVYQINNLDDYRHFRAAINGNKRVLVIGAGLIGCEYANDLASAGLEVTVVELMHGPLAAMLPKEASEAVHDGLQAAGVSFCFGRKIERIDHAGEGIIATLDNGDTLKADLALAAIGVQPNLELARQAGLILNRGIVVNRFLETSQINIFALGDCAEVQGLVLPFVMPLTAHVRALAHTLAGINTEVNYGVMPVHVKTPSVPIIFYRPKTDEAGQWQVERNGVHCKALCKSDSGRLLGLALTGDYTALKNELVPQLPPMLDDSFILPNGKATPEAFYRKTQGLWESITQAWWGA